MHCRIGGTVLRYPPRSLGLRTYEGQKEILKSFAAPSNPGEGLPRLTRPPALARNEDFESVWIIRPDHANPIIRPDHA